VESAPSFGFIIAYWLARLVRNCSPCLFFCLSVGRNSSNRMASSRSRI